MDLLAIYLNDHLGGSTFGLELVRRACRENRGTELGAFLDRLAKEIDEDRYELLRIMGALGVRRRRAKLAAGWLLERANRLKPNARLRRYSPLSRVLELEALGSGVRGKLSLWNALHELAPEEPRLDAERLAALIERAERQLTELTEHLRPAAKAALLPR